MLSHLSRASHPSRCPGVSRMSHGTPLRDVPWDRRRERHSHVSHGTDGTRGTRGYQVAGDQETATGRNDRQSHIEVSTCLMWSRAPLGGRKSLPLLRREPRQLLRLRREQKSEGGFQS